MSKRISQPHTFRHGVDDTHLAGPLELRDLRKSHATAIVIHRNTVPDLLRGTGQVGGHRDGDIDLMLTAEWYADPSNRYHSRLFPYHFVIDSNGVAHQVHDPSVVAPHAAGMNRKSVGIALTVDGRREPPTEAQYQAVCELVSALRARVMPDAPCVGHSELKQCPGRFVDIGRIDKGAKKDGSG